MADIVLTTLNAKYIHASLGLRCLMANLGELRARARLIEFTIDQRPVEIAEKLLAEKPRIIGLAVYIWNAAETARLAGILKRVAPEVTLVLGGPEVSHEQDDQPVIAHADYVIAGQGELAFAALAQDLLAGRPRADRFIQAAPPALDKLALPYGEYTDEDIAHRLVYVEASRGCPFRCEFCLSALDKTAWAFDLDRFLAEMDALHRRGVRHFKFVDRTFNLNVKASQRILDFFLERLSDDLFLHFEVIPDHLPEALKERLVRFPPGTLQLEVGVQSFNPEVQALISRKQDNAASERNLVWLREHTHAHLHADLIIGLPGEDLASFAAGFDRLWALHPHEIQVGMLKRLRGAPIARHTEAFGLRFDPHPPYTVLATAHIDFATMQRLARFARYWDLVGNSGRFARTLPLLLGAAPFDNFLAFSDWLWADTGQTSRIALPRLFERLHAFLTARGDAPETVLAALAADCAVHGPKGCPAFLHPHLAALNKESKPQRAAPERQARHLRGDTADSAR
ncbi:MAG: DUF4080 domain-containing protein [Thiohalomonadaceae bacterium]